MGKTVQYDVVFENHKKNEKEETKTSRKTASPSFSNLLL